MVSLCESLLCPWCLEGPKFSSVLQQRTSFKVQGVLYRLFHVVVIHAAGTCKFTEQLSSCTHMHKYEVSTCALQCTHRTIASASHMGCLQQAAAWYMYDSTNHLTMENADGTVTRKGQYKIANAMNLLTMSVAQNC